MAKGKQLKITLLYASVVLLAIGFVFPIFWTLMTSFKTYKEAFVQPPLFFVTPKLNNYIEFLRQSSILNNLKNSIIVTGISTLISLICGVMASYTLSRTNLRGTEGIALFLLLTRFIPPISTVIPIYLMLRALHLYDNVLGLILLHCAMNIPYVVWMMRGFFRDIPMAVEEAAWVEGCSRIQSLIYVVLPMSKGGLAATSVLILIFSWNEFLYALTMTGASAKTLPLSITAYMGEAGIEWNMMAAAGFIIMLPALVFSVFTHKNLAAGLTFGAVKE